jgi:BMFP domain-containing protein YqiC
MPIAAALKALLRGAISRTSGHACLPAVHAAPSQGVSDAKIALRCGRRIVPGDCMDKAPFLDELQDRLNALFAQTPAADLQKNLKALLAQQFARLELVTREEFDTQARVLARARARLEELERRLADLERQHVGESGPGRA